MRRAWIVTLATAAAGAAGFWIALFSLTALGIGPLARFSPADVKPETFEAIIGTYGQHQRILEEVVLAPALLLLSLIPFVVFRIRPAIGRSIVVACPLAFFAGATVPRTIGLLAIYSVAHYLLHLWRSRALPGRPG